MCLMFICLFLFTKKESCIVFSCDPVSSFYIGAMLALLCRLYLLPLQAKEVGTLPLYCIVCFKYRLFHKVYLYRAFWYIMFWKGWLSWKYIFLCLKVIINNTQVKDLYIYIAFPQEARASSFSGGSAHHNPKCTSARNPPSLSSASHSSPVLPCAAFRRELPTLETWWLTISTGT